MVEFLFILSLIGFGSKYAGEPFQLGYSARMSALGSPNAIFSKGAVAIATNPANLLKETGNWDFLVTHNELFGGALKADFGALAKRHGDLTFGIGLYLINASQLKETQLVDDSVVQTGEFSYSFKTIFIGAAKNGFGISIKILSEDLDKAKGVGIGFDFGYQKSWKWINLAISVHDITTTPIKWSTGKSEYILPSVNLGYTITVIDRIKIGTEGEIRFENIRLGSTFSVGKLSLDPHIGAEFDVHRNVALRVGLNRDMLTFGIGLRIKQFGLHYAYIPHTVLGASHKVSLTGSL